MGEWQEVWECPECGSQIAAGERGADYAIRFKPPTCRLAHSPREMEQKLSEAMPLRPEDAA
jgi:hypothetical protein